MRSPTTAHEALVQCEMLWEELAKTGDDIAVKGVTAKRVLGYLPANSCPACEYDMLLQVRNLMYCSRCPVDAWRRRAGFNEYTLCTQPSSPYGEWVDAESAEARKNAAIKILDLIRASEAYNV